ncbi:MAG: peptide/nickel transport system substrate-binding protein [Actinomycetota bacterium]|nr:peptide/nickel transport system substrate-binding protein [Actinomycetota bacterium]
MRMTSRRAWIAALALFAVVAAACGSSDSGTSGGGGAADSIVVGTTDSLQNSFDPAEAYDLFGANIAFNTAQTLVTYGPNATEPSPLLASKLPDVSVDGLTYTFELRPGVKFHDGTPLDSAAVKFSLERARDFGAKDAEAAGFLLSGIASIDTPSPTTVVIHLSKANVTFLSRLAYTVASIVSPTAYKNNVLTGTETPPEVLTKYKTDTVVGTGPYKIASYKEKESITLEANPDYWGDPPKTERVLIRLFDKSSALKLALQNREIDMAHRSLQPDELSSFRDQSGFKVIEGEGPGIRYVVFNVTKPPFDNLNLRKAVAAAIDRKPVVDEVLKGTGKPLDSMIPPTFDKTYEPRWAELYGTGTDKAKVDDYLQKAGIPAGQKVDLDFWFSPTHYGDTEAGVAQVLARGLEATGRFNVNISNVEWSEYGQKRRNGEMPVFLMGWFPDYLDVDDYLEPFADPSIFDPAKWDDPAMLDLVHAQQAALDPTARVGIIKQAQAYMAEQTPYVPVFQISQFAATTDKVSGVVLDPIQLFRFWLLEKQG